MIIKVPQLDEHNNSLWQWNRFIEELQPVVNEQEAITLDFSICQFITSEGIALLAGLKLLRDEKGFVTHLDYDSINGGVNSVLERCGFIPLFTGIKSDEIHKGTTFPILFEKEFDKERALVYMDEVIFSLSEMPDMSEKLEKEIRKAFFEVFGNIFTHSESKIGGLVCGQIFPTDQIIQVVFYDAGIGIASRVKNNNAEIKNDDEAIAWALERGNSTLSNETVSRGLGLYLIRDFIKINKGMFRICSNTGVIMETAGEREQKLLSFPLQGTIIDLRIRIDSGHYQFENE